MSTSWELSDRPRPSVFILTHARVFQTGYFGNADVLSCKNEKKLAQLETPIARYKPGQKEKSGNSCCFQHIDHLFLGHHHHITRTPSQNDQGTIKT